MARVSPKSIGKHPAPGLTTGANDYYKSWCLTVEAAIFILINNCQNFFQARYAESRVITMPLQVSSLPINLPDLMCLYIGCLRRLMSRLVICSNRFFSNSRKAIVPTTSRDLLRTRQFGKRRFSSRECVHRESSLYRNLYIWQAFPACCPVCLPRLKQELDSHNLHN